MKPLTPEQIHKQVHRIRISIKDLDDCIEFAKEMGSTSSKITLRALLTSAIVSYARPFSNNMVHDEATSQPQFSLKKCLTQSEQELHERICKIRDTSIAHSDFEMNHVRAEKYYQNGLALRLNFYDPLSELPNVLQILSLATKIKHLLAAKMHELAAMVGKGKSFSSETLPEGITEIDMLYKTLPLNIFPLKH